MDVLCDSPRDASPSLSWGNRMLGSVSQRKNHVRNYCPICECADPSTGNLQVLVFLQFELASVGEKGFQLSAVGV